MEDSGGATASTRHKWIAYSTPSVSLAMVFLHKYGWSCRSKLMRLEKEDIVETTTNLEEAARAAQRPRAVAYLATVAPARDSHVSPVYPAWSRGARRTDVDMEHVKVRKVEASSLYASTIRFSRPTTWETLLI